MMGQLERGRISNIQLTVLIIAYIFGSTVILSPGGSAGHDVWIAVLIGLLEGLLIAWIFTALATQFKNKTIIEINNLVYGSILGKVISMLFIWYLFHLGALVLNSFNKFISMQIYHFTPRAIILFLLVLVCASTAARGIEVIARCTFFLFFFSSIIFALDTMLVIPHMELKNLLPVFDVSIGKLLWAGHDIASIHIGEAVAFLMILAFTDKPEKRKTAVLWGVLIAGLIGLTSAVRNTAVIGQMGSTHIYPSYLTVQVINVGEIITRFEAVIAVNLMTNVFIRSSVLLYGTALGLAQLFNLRSYKPLILPTGILMIVLALTNVSSVEEMFAFAYKGYAIYAIPFQLGIPLLTLVVAKLRKLPH